MKQRHLTLERLRFAFTTKGPLFFDVPFLQLMGGCVYLLIGSNGSGKSTFFTMVRGTVRSDELLEGRLSYGQYTIPLDDKGRARQLATIVRAVPQRFDELLVPSLTVEEHSKIAYMSRFPRLRFIQRDRSLEDALIAHGIPLTASIDQLSGGQRQAVALALLLHKPAPVFLLDEPTAALDGQQTRYVVDILHKYAQEHTSVIIMITHDQELIASYDPSLCLEVVIDPISRLRTVEHRRGSTC